jgi:hypothetical protein
MADETKAPAAEEEVKSRVYGEHKAYPWLCDVCCCPVEAHAMHYCEAFHLFTAIMLERKKSASLRAALARAEAENARAAEEGFKIAARLTARVEEAEARAARAEGEVKRTKTHGPHSNPATCPSWNDWCNCGSDNLDAILAVVREEAARGAEARAARAEGERDLACKAFGMAREQRNEALDRIESLEAALAAATARGPTPDPHHGGASEWKFEGGAFWHRVGPSGRWVQVKRLSLTPARVVMLAGLVPREGESATHCENCQQPGATFDIAAEVDLCEPCRVALECEDRGEKIAALQAALAAATARAERYREALEAVAAHNDTDRCCDQKQAEATRCAICWPRYVAVRALASGAEGRE